MSRSIALTILLPLAAARGGTPPVVVAPFDATGARAHQQAWAKHLAQPVEVANSMDMKFALIPPGEFTMGSPENEVDRLNDEKQHRVRITRPFYLGTCEVMQGDFEELMGGNPSYWSSWGYRRKRGKDVDTSRFPVDRVSWLDAVEFCRRLSALPSEQAAGRRYRLATEAEWEYACRAGTTTPYHFGSILDGTQANACGEHPYGTDKKGRYLNRPTNAASYPPNDFGIFDMHGGVWEWCADWLARDYYGKSPVDDPPGPDETGQRVIRGGAWRFSCNFCRAAVRHGYDPRVRAYDTGFRVALDVPTAQWITTGAAPPTGSNTSASATVEIDAAAETANVNPHMYGIFFEEINHAGDGGLYGELVRNRSFEDCNVPEGMKLEGGFAVAKCRDKIPWPPKEPVPGWIMANKQGASSAMLLDKEKVLNSAQATSLRWEITAATKEHPAGIANTGYWDMAFTDGETCDLNLFACAAPGFAGALTAVLEARDGTAISNTASVRDIGGDWKQFHFTLPAKSTRHDARLALYSDAPGTIWLDVVSLFSRETYNGRPNGFRADLLRMLKDLRPGFVRFPGGCVTEGLTLEQGHAWKKTIGDIADRPGVWNAMWGYRRTDGLGMLEFLQLAEDIGATALFCNNMGIACTIHTPGGVPCPTDQIQSYVDDTVDAISYAIDPPTTKWGALRAAHGHPEPFRLDYVNIGNELNSREYTERYPAFYQAVKDRYPAITTIAYAPVGKPKAPVEIKDLHDYRDEAWFRANMNRFDQHDRQGPRLATMEFSVRNRNTHTLHNALLEAAYMIGLERNADLIRLVAYAPLFMNTNDKRWEPDLIHFDNHRVYGTPSYYTQQLFMHHRPDAVLATRVDAGKDPDFFVLAGRDKTHSEIVIKIVNLGNAEKPVNLSISNAGALSQGVAEWVLTSPDPLDKNSFETPAKVAPATKVSKIDGNSFVRIVPPHSFTVLRMGHKRD